MLVDGLPDYERMMARSLALWDNALEEMDRADLADSGLSPEVETRIENLRLAIADIRYLLPKDDGPIRPAGLWKELQSEMDFLHKRIVHAMPEREYAHRKLRIIEQLILDIQEHGHVQQKHGD